MIELGRMRGRVAGADALLNMLPPRVGQFMDSLKRSFKEEDWFDPATFVRFVLVAVSTSVSMKSLTTSSGQKRPIVRHRNRRATLKRVRWNA